MAIFRRSRDAGRLPAPPDRDLPCLDLDQAGRFRIVVREALAELGVEAMVAPDYVVDRAQRRYPLAELAALCARTDDEAMWPDLVRRHLEALRR